MPKFVVEREIPGVGQLTTAELQGVSQNSFGVISELGPGIEWIESYVTDDKIYGVFIADDEDLLRQHAWQTGFPLNKISAVAAVINPRTVEGQFDIVKTE